MDGRFTKALKGTSLRDCDASDWRQTDLKQTEVLNGFAFYREEQTEVWKINGSRKDKMSLLPLCCVAGRPIRAVPTRIAAIWGRTGLYAAASVTF